MDEDLIIWSDMSFTLEAFVQSFPQFPQLVQVESGVYSENDAQTLSAGQILKLQLIKRTDKILAKVTGESQGFFIPVNSKGKVQILPTVCQDVYYSVQDFVDDTCVKFISVVHDSPPSLRLKAGDILEVKKTIEEKHGKYVECKFVNKTQDSVKLPLDFKAAFKPLAQANQYEFVDALQRFTLPIRVKFVFGEILLHDSGVPLVGSVLLKEKREESTIICTSRTYDKVTVLMVPLHLDVSVRPAKGAFVNDKEYVRICKNIHDGVDLEKVDVSLVNVPRLCEESVEEVVYDYAEVKPLLPPRDRPGSPLETSDDEYWDVDPSPPRKPPLPRPISAPKPGKLKSADPLVSNLKLVEYGQGRSERGLKSNLGFAKNYLGAKCFDKEALPPALMRTVSRGYHKVLPEIADRVASQRYNNVLPKSDKSEHLASRIPCLKESRIVEATMARNNERVDKKNRFEDNPEYCNDDDDDDDDDDNEDDVDKDYLEDYIYMDDPFLDDDSDSDDHGSTSAQGNDSSTPSTPRKPLKTKPKSLLEKITTKQVTRCLFPKNFSKGNRIAPRHLPAPSPMNSSRVQPTSSSHCVSNQSGFTGFPDDISCLTVAEVGVCLKKLNLGKYVQTFESKQIDGDMLTSLTDEASLKSLGVSEMFDRRKMLRFIQGWRPKV